MENPAVEEDDGAAQQILKNLLILPPLQKKGTFPEDLNELQDAMPLPPIRAEEPVASIRAALGDICGYAHLTNYRFVLENKPPPVKREQKRKGDSSSSFPKALASPYTGQNAVISVPVAVKSLNENGASKTSDSEEKMKVLDEFGDLTSFLKDGLEDGSAFRIVLERYDASSIRDHVTRLRALLDGNPPNSFSLEDESGESGVDKPSREEGEDPSDDTSDRKDSKASDEVEGKENSSKDDTNLQKAMKDPPKDIPAFHDGKPLSPDTKDLKHFFYYACGEDPALYLEGEKNPDGSPMKDNGAKSKKNRKKKNNSKTIATNNSGSDDDADDATKKEQSIREIMPQLNELEEKTRIPCSIRFSGFHPPPPFRRLMGDIAYLEVSLPDASIVHITGTPMGFFVNKSSTTGGNYTFDPTPASKPCFSHELLDCLLQYSESLAEAWSQALAASKIRGELTTKINEDGPFFSFFRVAIRGDFPGYKNPSVASASEGIDSLIQKPSWLVPIPLVEEETKNSWNRNCEHVYNTTRTEEELSNSFGVDIRGGSLRDWNEELQVAREMPVNDIQERIERARYVTA
jgi:protein TIF31